MAESSIASRLVAGFAIASLVVGLGVKLTSDRRDEARERQRDAEILIEIMSAAEFTFRGRHAVSRDAAYDTLIFDVARCPQGIGLTPLYRNAEGLAYMDWDDRVETVFLRDGNVYESLPEWPFLLGRLPLGSQLASPVLALHRPRGCAMSILDDVRVALRN